jgi:hypothetical protein
MYCDSSDGINYSLARLYSMSSPFVTLNWGRLEWSSSGFTEPYRETEGLVQAGYMENVPNLCS